MSKTEKLLEKFKSIPNDLTWDELVKILNYLGYFELSKKGKTGGSRRKFVNELKDVINLHKPHPTKIIKKYMIKQLLEKL
ncbi:hexulose-6-phosphate isomerase [Formosa sp. Hel1_33_131]|jgi:predicted RNA binding protein YcfA (HicA-like mRNA interferase family)|uniref:type II toxin-antitoxin system HicA family toxin n=1 Tax=Formosa sp. Hel1_33_131 TaxID=1336794 RepID=UPI00084E2D28|nr:type II toxin-antitoxin system HicA family toxin [Formosa sp. Hel1_33_131]AOR28075.1 hexulose-6-phosphate isomerase [Formosa sp. Hel1_33_131]